MGIFLKVVAFLCVYLLPTSTNLIMAEEHESKVLQANGAFSQKLYQILARNSGNLIFSPISVHTVLAMASQGAGGTTKDAFLSTLNIPDNDVAAKGYSRIIRRLYTVRDVALVPLKKIYIKNEFAFQPSFEDVIFNKFFSKVESIDFAKANAAASYINKWVQEKTNDKIENLVTWNDFDQHTRLVLLSAISFKGDWKYRFDKAQTKIEPFYINEQDTVNVNMMHNKKRFEFKEDSKLDAKVLVMPYVNPELAMVIILPNKRNGLSDLEEKLANTDLTSIVDGLHFDDVIVSLPKFKLESTINLNPVLTEMGLGEIFTPAANLSGMIEGNEPLYVSKVIQGAFIEVNEKGSGAAAVTRPTETFYSLNPHHYTFIADHPFVFKLIFAIAKNQTAVELITGIYKENE